MSIRIKRNILLNPGPVTTTDTVKRALLVSDICHREQEFTELLKAIRQDLLKVVHAGNDYTTVLFSASGTGAMEACISSVVPANKKIAIINNGSYGQRMINIARRYKIDVVEIKFPYDQPVSLDIVESTLNADLAIQYLALVHHETSMGFLNPLHDIGEICHRLQRHLIVDAMSSFAGVEIDVNRDHIDFIIASSNKCLHGMPGLSFVLCKTDSVLAAQEHARSYYFDLYQQYASLESTGQMPFTPPVQIAYSFKQALDEYFLETPAGRMKRYQNNYTHLVEGLKAFGFTCVIPASRQSHLLVTVKFPQDGNHYDFDELHDYLYYKGYTIYPKKLPIPHTFRLACIGDLNEGEIDSFLVELKYYMSSKQFQQMVEKER